jgi:hypothetical protein
MLRKKKNKRENIKPGRNSKCRHHADNSWRKDRARRGRGSRWKKQINNKMADKQQATTPAKEHVIEEDDEFEEFENEGTLRLHSSEMQRPRFSNCFIFTNGPHLYTLL